MPDLPFGKLSHTPGPWTATRRATRWDIEGPTPRPHDHDRGMQWLVARTVSLEPEDEPNARLIAAAPKLLTALRDARLAVVAEYRSVFGERAEQHPLVLQIDEAIADAEGR